MIKKYLPAILLFLLIYSAFLIYNAPSSFLVPRVNARLAPVHARLTDSSGGLWSGDGTLFVRGTDLGQLHWRLSPWPLLSGHLDATLHLKGDDIRARSNIQADSRTLKLTQFQGRAGMGLMARLAGMPGSVVGTLVADLQSVRLSSRGLPEQARGEIDVHGARLPAFSVGLGTIYLRLKNANSRTIEGAVHNSGGDLDISGKITLTDGTRYHLDAYLKPHPGQKNDAMRDAFSAVIGAPDGQGRYHYVTNGRLFLR